MTRLSGSADAGWALRAGVAGVLVFGAAWALVHLDVFASFQLVDTPLYERYGRAVLDGAVPYRDFSVEYPPGALLMFVLPALAGDTGFREAFEALHGLMGALVALIVALALARLGASRQMVVAGALLAGLTPLLLGPVVLTRFDYWPAVLLAGSLLALVYERPHVAMGLLAAAVSAKLYPLVVVPLALAHVARRYGGAVAARAAAAFAVVLAAVVVPFLVVAPDGVVDSVRSQTDRPLQIESLGASVLQVGDLLGLYERTIETSFGSQNLVGTTPDVVATLTTILQLLAVVGVWLLFVRLGPTAVADVATLLGASAAAIATFVALGKVLSPQFMIWLAAIVPLALGRSRAASGAPAALALTALALVLTHVWFPSRYWDLVGLESGEAVVVLARNLAVCGLAAALALTWLRRARVESAAGLRGATERLAA